MRSKLGIIASFVILKMPGFMMVFDISSFANSFVVIHFL